MFPVKQKMMSSVESEEEVEQKLKKSERDLKQLLWEVEGKTDLFKTGEHWKANKGYKPRTMLNCHKRF